MSVKIKILLWRIIMASHRKRRGNKQDDSLVKIYEETKGFFNKNKYPVDPALVYDVSYRDMRISKSELVQYPISIEVENEDSFLMAQRYVEQGLKPVVLNFASNTRPGGGVERGCKAQEEDLFRRSNYHQSLNMNCVDYPINDQVVYSPKVWIARTPTYEWLKSPIQVACIAAAAARRPSCHIDHDNKERFTEISVRDHILNVVKYIFDVAIVNGHDSLVLGAWGCGVYRGPRDDIVDIFSEVIHSRGMYFKKIGFPVLIRDDSDCVGEENFECFKTLEKLSES